MSLAFLQGATDLLVAALDEHLHPGVEDYLDLFTEDAIVEIPYAADGGDRMEGRSDIAAYMEKLRGVVVLEAMTLKAAHWSRNDIAVLEYDGQVLAVGPGTRFAQSYIAVVGLRNGRIALFREYSNPLPAMEAFKA